MSRWAKRRGNGRVAAVAVGASLVAAALLAACGGDSGSGSMGDAGNPGGVAATPAVPPSSSPPAVAQAKDENTTVDPAIVSADNTFGLNLLNTVIAIDGGGNTAIAPISAAMALQIAYNGAGGSTQQAMAATLQLNGLSVSQLNSDNAALLASLIDPDPQVTVTVANSLWLHLSGNQVAQSFTTADQTYYGAEIGDLAGAPANVNAWVATQTNGLITQILPPGNYAVAAAVIANVVYFKGQWSSTFNPQLTAAGPFTLADGTQTSAQMMQQTTLYPYFQGANFQAVGLPYGQGRLSMLVVLPEAGVDLAGFVATMTVADIGNWVSQMKPTEVGITLPRFTATYSGSLIPPLTNMGMGVALNPNAADFSGICAGAYIADAEHETVVEVDESGTVAAGATTITIGTTVAPSLGATVTVNHPFFYAIRDNLTGELLFVGVLMNPG
jgi:serine protease inhibitor